MSTDKYSGGSFLYWENINISKSSKSFKLSDRIVEYPIHKRWTDIIALIGPYDNWNNLLSFSTDWYIEDTDYYNNTGSITRWWAIYKRSTWWYNNATKIWNYTIWLTTDKLDLFTWDPFNSEWFNISSNLVANNFLTSNTSRTVGAWWTTWATWAVHSTWTATLTQTLTVTNTTKYRVTVRSEWCTTGTCAITMWWTNMWTISSTSPTWSFKIRTTASTSEAITFTPSTDFNWTITNVSVVLYVVANIEEWKATITSSTSHPLLSTWWILYIGSWSKVDAVNTTSWAIDTYSVIDSSHTIVAIHEIWQSIVIFSTNQEDSKISYWDWVSLSPSEVILWKDKVITNAIVDWNMSYVLCESQIKKELYIMSGYDKKLIAKWDYCWNSFWWNHNAYRLKQRNDFYNYPWCINALWWNWNKCIIPAYNWLYTYGYENPNWVNALIKELVVNTSYISATANVSWEMYIAYKDSTTNTATIWKIRNYNNSTTSWYIVSNPILRDNFSTKKQLNRFRIGYIIPSSTSSIDILLSVNNNNFITFTTSNITVLPIAWSTYDIYWNILTVIWASTNSVWWTLTYNNIEFSYGWSITKTSWTGDSSITFTDRTNFIKLKTITATKYTQWEELIFWQEFLQAYMPERHTIQLKIQLNSSTVTGSPEIFDIPILAEPVGQNG